MWHKYKEIEPIRRLRNRGRELLGQIVLLQEKRDGENVPLWPNEEGVVNIASHNLPTAGDDIKVRMMATPEYEKAVQLIEDERSYNKNVVLYGELLKEISPTRLEPRKKNLHWILFDIYDLDAERYCGYEYTYQRAFHFRIPIVRVIDRFVPENLEELQEKVDSALDWCKRHRREGIVGKCYKIQEFFKEKRDIPKLPKIRDPSKVKPQLPPMDEHTVLRALQHAFDEVGEEDWEDKSKAMPVVAKHFEVEAREHNFATPRNMYKLYLDIPIEKLKAGGE